MWAHEGIVLGVNDQGECGYFAQELPGADALIVVVGVPKTMQRRRHQIIKLAKCAAT